MKKIILFIFLIILLPLNVYAGGGEDDTTYTTTYESGYTYGNVKECSPSSGTAYRVGLRNVSGKTVYLWNTKDALRVHKFICEDKTMEQFTLGKVTGSDGKEYYGLGCRKINDNNKLNYTVKEIEVGYSEYVIDMSQTSSEWTHSECTFISGGENGHWGETISGPNCQFYADKEGTTRIRVLDTNTYVAKYYEFNISNPITSVSQLDDKYTYGNVKTCNAPALGYNYGEKVKMDGYTFCGNSLPGYNYEGAATCEDESYETFKLTFKVDNKLYKGFGCRKINKVEEIVYTKKQIYAGYSEYVIDMSQTSDEWTHTECTFMDGEEYAHWGETISGPNCQLYADKVGITKIRVYDTKTGVAKYYEYEIIAPADAVTSLDDNYLYGSVDKCSLYSQGYNLGGKVGFSGYTFCASALPGYNYEKSEVTCLNSKYELFTLAFKSENKLYKGYGCRCKKGTECDFTPKEPDVITQTCDSLLGSPSTNGSPAFYLSVIFNVLKYVAIVILIVMTILDFIGAVSSQDNDVIKKAVNKAMKRAILCVIIFVLPTIIEFILQFVHNRTITTCDIGK